MPGHGQRYSARPREDGDGYGVHDAAFSQWTGPGRYTKERAERIAADLELHHQRQEEARPMSRRRVDPPRKVRARLDGVVVEALLHHWDRSTGSWMGEVELKPARRLWLDVDALTPLDDV